MTRSLHVVRRLLAACLAVTLLLPLAARAQDTASITAYTQKMEKRYCYFPLYWDAKQGRLLLEITRTGEDFLYLRSLATGLGIAGLDLDRGTIADEAMIARFERVGPRVLFVLQHPQFRATDTRNAELVRSVHESFPTSTPAACDIVAEEGGRVLVDATPLVLDDVVDLRRALQEAGEGSFALDKARSTVFLERTKAFPRNTEVEVTLTFTTDSPGRRVRQHAPDARAITLRQHHSFVKLPDPGYRTRKFDPRVGVYPVIFYDFGKPFNRDYVTRYAVRHRLQKKNPRAAVSESVEPIVYYLDRGVPEPYRTAFKRGAMWWKEAFEAAGFRNAFRVEDMPPGMDPLDARYNVIQWVHRSEPSSSWGASFIDPRTGEIIKAAVRMDSHRSLVDYNIYAAALPAADVEQLADPLGGGALDDWLASLDPRVTAGAFAMARRRQHAAHEVGHTLGLAHNFIAASYGRASAMAYPAPLLKLDRKGRIDLSDAYREGLGAYDTLAIRYAYEEFPEGKEEAGLQALVEQAMAKKITFMTNPDEDPSTSHPEATTWINGADAVAELERVMDVRRALMVRFDERAIAPGEPMALLNHRFVTVYLHHRYTLGAAVKAVGGMEYRYAVRGDTLAPTRIIEPARQRRALGLLLDAIQPAELAVPERVLTLMAPPPFGYEADRFVEGTFGPTLGEKRGFTSKAAPAFDQIGIARTLATMVVRGILAPERAARLVAFADRNPRAPTLTEVVGRLVERTWGTTAPREHAALKRVGERAVVDELIRLAADTAATSEARAGAEWGLRRVARLLQAPSKAESEEAAHRAFAAADIDRFLSRRDAPTPRTEPIPAPPGTPIGGGAPPEREPRERSDDPGRQP